MYEDWPKTTKTLSAQLRNLRGSAPEVMCLRRPRRLHQLEPSIWFAEDFDTVDLNGLRRCCRSLSS